MKILLVHCHYRLPGGEDAVFAAERAMLERHGHEVLVYERSNEEAAHGLPKALLPLHAVWNRAAARGSSAPLLTLMATCRLGESCWYKYTFASEPEPNFWANVYPGI